MLKRLFLVLAALSVFVMWLSAPVAHAREAQVVGVIVSIDADAMQVMRDTSRETVTVTLQPDTKYLKWILAKPWQQDIRTTRGSLKLGMRVRIDAEPHAPSVARTVWVVVGRPGYIGPS